jgi:hypothetical protein
MDIAGNPIPNAMLFIGSVPAYKHEREQSARARTEADGKFIVNNLGRGEYLLSTMAEDFASSTVLVNVRHGKNTIDIVLNAGARIEGYVIKDGEGITNFFLSGTIQSSDVNGNTVSQHLQTNTNADGFFSLSGFYSGHASLVAYSSQEIDLGQAAVRKDFEISLNTVTEINFTHVSGEL